jgi:hypothetical protein
MKPVNSKSLFAFVCDQMEKLNAKEIGVDEAKAQSNLAKQANNILKYELDRASLQIKLHELNQTIKDTPIVIREVESKKFDNSMSD